MRKPIKVRTRNQVLQSYIENLIKGENVIRCAQTQEMSEINEE